VRTPDGGEPVTFYYSRDARVADASEVRAVVHRHNGSRNRARADDAGTFEWPTPPAFRAQGLCREFHLRSWFPDTSADAAKHYPAALLLCMKCPVRVECATYAIDNDERFGMWGGTTPRRRLSAANPTRRKKILYDIAAGKLQLDNADKRLRPTAPPRVEPVVVPWLTVGRGAEIERRRAINAEKRARAIELWKSGMPLTQVSLEVDMSYSTVKWWAFRHTKQEAS